MDWRVELLMAARVVVAALLGALMGWEREQHGREAGVRTYAAVALGACVFALVSSHAVGATDATRIAAQVVVGIGFLGAGVIMHNGDRVTGLTTAATLWVSAAVGLAIAYGMYVLGVLATLITYGLLVIHHVGWWQAFTRTRRSVHGEDEGASSSDP